MKAKEFYRILSRVRGMEWRVHMHDKVRMDTPSTTAFIHGVRRWCYHSPLSAVATCVKRRYVDVANTDIPRILNLDRRTYRRIQDASYESPGHSKTVRRKLLAACGIRYR